jgi:hypothetical protein
MTDQQQHRATPEQWENIEEYRDDGYDDGYGSYIIELRDRIAALEAAQASQFRGATEMVAPSALTDSLMERVARAIYDAPNTHEGWRSEARAAIREVAAWLDTKGQHGCSLWLREEASR